MHTVFIIAALAMALTAGFATVHPGHHPGSPLTVTTFDGGGDNNGGSGGSINGGGPPG
jgi:hypothetical protein